MGKLNQRELNEEFSKVERTEKIFKNGKEDIRKKKKNEDEISHRFPNKNRK